MNGGVIGIDERKAENIMMKGEIWERSKDIQRQEEESKIKEAKYNKEYKEIKVEVGYPRYLWEERRGNVKEKPDGNYIRAMMKTRCGNMVEENKYWLEENKRKCVFCGLESDNLEHYVRGCEEVKEWFMELGSSEGKSEKNER